MTTYTQTPFDAASYAKFDEQYQKGTVSADHLRRYPNADLIDRDDPEKSLNQFVDNYFVKCIEKVVAGKMIPHKVSSITSAAAHFERHLEARIPVMCKTATENPDKSVISFIPFLYNCPLPSLEEKKAVMSNWIEDSDTYNKMRTLSGGRSFIPYIIHGGKGRLVLLSWVMISR